MKDATRILYVSLAVGVLFGVLSFFKAPVYEKGAWAVIGVVVLIVTNIMTAKFTAHQIEQQPGTNSVVETSTPPEPVPAVEASHENQN